MFQTTGADRNLEMRVYDATGAILAVNTTLGKGSKDMRAAFEAEADGDYYVGVCNPNLFYTDEKPAEPLVTVTARRAEDFTGPDDLDEFDPGDDTWRGATPLTAVPGQVGDSPIAVGDNADVIEALRARISELESALLAIPTNEVDVAGEVRQERRERRGFGNPGEWLETMKKDAKKYDEFYAAFGTVLKEGVHTDWENADRIKKLLKYPTARGEDGKRVFLEESGYRPKSGEPLRGFMPNWIGRFYAYYQWTQRMSSRETLEAIPLSFLKVAYGGLHDLDLALAVDRLADDVAALVDGPELRVVELAADLEPPGPFARHPRRVHLPVEVRVVRNSSISRSQHHRNKQKFLHCSFLSSLIGEGRR